MVVIAWLGAGAFLVGVVALLIRAIWRQAESREEMSAALLAYAAAIPGAMVITVAAFGASPLLLAVPGLVYGSVLLITRQRPLLLLGYFIERIDRKASDRYAARLIGVFVVVGLIVGLLAEWPSLH